MSDKMITTVPFVNCIKGERNVTTAAERSLIDRDIAHLVHPLHNQAAHESAKVWVGGKGAYITCLLYTSAAADE